ncbi:MAG TPA: nitroreductase family protein [Candidatus Bathyarchaeia archaeon]|nr:nitroreductase family protein [Candidatus Bathyarchaeia archaeon]
MDFARTVLSRKMIRAFKPDPVPREKIDRILSLAQHYPSAGYSQEVAFVVVTDQEQRKRIRELRDLKSDAPVLLIPCVSEKIVHDRYHEPDKIRSGGKEINWPVPFWYFDVGCSCMLVFLAAADEGLAAAFAGNVGIFKPGILRKELGIPKHYEPVGVLSLGYPDLASEVPSASLKRGRRPFKDFVHREKW